MLRKLVGVWAVALPLLAWHYYRNGHKEEIFPIGSWTRGSTLLYFRTSNDIELGVGQRVVFRPKNDECLQTILKRYSYSIKKIGDDVTIVVEDPKKAIEIANAIYETGCVYYSHPDFLISPRKRTLDPLFNPQQWNLYNYGQFYSKPDVDLNVYEAWLYSRGENVTIALIDDGFDLGHEDFTGAFVGGYNVIYGTNDIKPDNAYEFHGTLCAGLIGARRNSVGIVGTAPESKLYGVKLLLTDRNGNPLPLYTTDIVKAFILAQNADVINCSWGTYNVADNVRHAIEKVARYGRDGKGIPIVFASGNDGMPQYYWEKDESALESVIAVGAVTNLGEHPWYSNYGPYLDFVAPSGGGTLAIATTDLQGSWGLAKGYYGHPDYTFANDMTGFNGTSAAAPQIAGVIALMLARDPKLTRDEIVHILKITAKKVGDIPYYHGRNDYFGYGLVDAKAALEEVIRRSVSKVLAERSFKIDGYFIHYGDGAFDWLYVSSSLRFVAKLEGLKADGKYLKWKRLYFDSVKVNGEEIRLFGPLSQDPLERSLTKKRLKIDGYFVHYASEPYDWIYLSAKTKKVYKFEGLDYRKRFLWVKLLLTYRFIGEKVTFFRK
jgi:subtilisin family serine protease